MYEAFSELLTFSEKVGEIKEVRFFAEDGPYHNRSAEISGITSDGEEFTVSMDFKKVSANADR